MPCNPAYRQAIELAWTSLQGLGPAELVTASGGYMREGEIVLPSMGGETTVDLRDRMVMTPDELGGGWGLAALHHLKGCLGWKEDDELVSFEQIEGSAPFAAAFKERAVLPLAERFGADVESLAEAATRFDGEPGVMGDASFLFHAFPRLKVVVVVWRGDGEVSNGASLLYDRGGAATLPAEDLAEVGISISQALISTAR